MSRFKDWKEPMFDSAGWAYSVDQYMFSQANDMSEYGWRCQHHRNLVLGEGVDIGCFTYMNAKYGIVIGEDVQIGSHCSIYTHNSENDVTGSVIIGDNCSIGSHTTILPGSELPSNTKVPAYSIVMKRGKYTYTMKLKRELVVL